MTTFILQPSPVPDRIAAYTIRGLKRQTGIRHTTTAMGEDIFLEIMQKIPRDKQGWEKDN